MRLAALLFFASAALHAQPAPPDTLAEVTVTAARQALPARDAPSRVTVLDRADLEAAAATSAADALGARAPVHVRRYGPSGLASVTVRGAGSSQALVLLDGQPLTDPQLGQVDLGLLPSDLVGAIEVVSGPSSALHGSAALGGVIALRPLEGGGTSGRLTTEAGPWGERRLSAAGTAESGALEVVAAGTVSQADDDYTFVDRGRLDRRRATRDGWDSRLRTGYARVAHVRPRGRAQLSLWAADAERGLGGADGVGARQWDSRVRLGATADHQTTWGRLEAAGSVQTTRLRYAAPFPAPSDRPDAIDDTGRTLSAFADVRATAPSRSWAWTGALSAGAAGAEHPRLKADAQDRFVGVALSGTGALGRAVVFPSVRADLYAPANQERRVALSPQVGVNVPAGAWNLKASAARAFRMPTLNDRFWQPGGNPDLRPESAWSLDAGAVWTSGATQAEVTAFAARARDQIVWTPTAAGFFAPVNVSRTRSVGLEGSARTARRTPLGVLEAGGVATLLDARDLDAGAPLRYVPRWTAKAWAGLEAGALRLGLGARAVGARFTTASASQPLPTHFVLDAQVSVRRRVGPSTLTLGVAAENLTGLQYEVVKSYPMPPRHARLRLTLS